MTATLTTTFSVQQLAAYQQDGFYIARGLFDDVEINKLLQFAQADPNFASSLYGRKDSTGKETKLALWNQAGDDLYSMYARSPQIADRMEQCLGGEVYLYHMKMMLKEPHVGGAWEWHQDYGYWYNNGCLFPLLASCLIAVNQANKANGCLQVLRGSHHLGRIDHGKTGDQTGADLERVNAALEQMELVYCECAPGDAIFFDSNLLHRSDANNSDDPRWSLICCYNAARNNPYKESKHPRYTPLDKVAVSAIREWQASS
ncbi:phytanoyl-CoA dioxygenase family protein [Anatilimnocola floriformis]|uniref:phytanoyl-CoA dioxygenase family protein n=1 Tax=Anatilimnocola floriformis TaxID=2948575 RepID=UPI0020C32640|nr:phytanoyl-CoA dioxygenase family protein [Anatilimnocola floriformis]